MRLEKMGSIELSQTSDEVHASARTAYAPILVKVPVEEALVPAALVIRPDVRVLYERPLVVLIIMPSIIMVVNNTNDNNNTNNNNNKKKKEQ